MPGGAIRVDNLRRLQIELGRAAAKDVQKEVRAANKGAADIVRDEAKTIAPVVSGKLAKSIGSAAQRDSASVKAGTAKGVQYAGVIHFGHPARGIPARPFLYEALDDRRDEVKDAYDAALSKISLDLSSNNLKRI